MKTAPLSMVLDQNPLVSICSDFRVQCRETELGESLWEKREVHAQGPNLGLVLTLLALSTSGGHIPPAPLPPPPPELQSPALILASQMAQRFARSNTSLLHPF